MSIHKILIKVDISSVNVDFYYKIKLIFNTAVKNVITYLFDSNIEY